MRGWKKSIFWPLSIEEARECQEVLAAKVKLTPFKNKLRFVAGVDAAFSENRVYAAACLFSYPDLRFIEETTAVAQIRFPYVPGFLSFREGPAITMAISHLKTSPGLILVDGQGIAHPRGIGIASHIGVLLDIPTVGCAKSRLIGEFIKPGRNKGEASPLTQQGKTIGVVLRTRAGVRPLYISPGHKINLEKAIEVVLACTRQYRIPEPLRRADSVSKRVAAGCY
jgi:deoxyribonuclease V